MSLHDLQVSFSRAVIYGERKSLLAFVVGNHIAGEDRVRVYQNNVQEGLTKALASAYPVIEKLVGRACFRTLARDYIRRFPSEHGDLQHYGSSFSALLRDALPGAEYRYMSDVADLEWAYQEVLVAADPEPFDMRALESVPAHLYETLTFTLHPASRLVASRYPISAIWRANQPWADSGDFIDLGSGGEYLLVHRPAHEVSFRALTAAEHEFVASLDRGESLSMALESALSQDSDFDLPRTLTGLIQSHAIVDHSMPYGV